MKLYMLFSGRSKKRMKHIMTDELHKVQTYRDAREATKTAHCRWHDIKPAPHDAVPWRKVNSGTQMWKAYNFNGPQKV
jgi:hypothetical protein